jgi:Condensin complex subunit 2
MLENLTRNNASGSYDDDDDDNEADSNDTKEVSSKDKVNKVNSKINSKRFDLMSTIEKNISSINAVKIEREAAVDPTFYKMSKLFDEGGAKGMLMVNTVSDMIRRSMISMPCNVFTPIETSSSV